MDTVRAELAVEGALVHEVIEMGESLAEGEAHLVPVEGAPEWDLDHFESGLRDAASGDHLIAARPVMRGEAIDPTVQPEEGEVVRGQGKRLGRYRIAQFGQGRQIAGKGVTVGLVCLHTDVGRDPR